MMAELSRDEMMAALAWQLELGADEAIGETPVNRFELPQSKPQSKSPNESTSRPGAEARALQAPPQAAPAARNGMPDSASDAVAEAEAAAAAADTLEALQAALAAYPHCELRHGARSLVFADGNPGSRVMIIGEAPGRDEDIQGKPFVGRAGGLLDRMLAAIGLDRAAPAPESAVYITNVLPWRPPQNRDPKPDEIAMLMPFLRRHVALANPDVIVAMGNISCQALLGKRGITRLRGTWAQALGLPCLPMFHPAYLLRTPSAKRESWADLLSLKAHLLETGGPGG
ncbi:MAG: uracil-DNA glycosylase [Pseudomonadota bacterium]